MTVEGRIRLRSVNWNKSPPKRVVSIQTAIAHRTTVLALSSPALFMMLALFVSSVYRSSSRTGPPYDFVYILFFAGPKTAS